MEEYKFLTYNVGKLNPVSATEYATVGGYAGLKIALANPSAVIQTIKDSGLRGRGGAGFPTGMKWTFVRNTEADQKYIVCNADEGEPGTNKDRILMAEVPNLLFEGMAIAGVAVGATKGYIYLRAEYPYVKEILLKALDDARIRHFLGKNVMGSDFDFDIEIRSGAGAYVCGEETALLESIEGKRGEPRYKPPFPGVQGLWGKPTVINNVETLCNIPMILCMGADFFKALGTPQTTGTKLFTLCGNIKNPGVYEFQTGITMRELFEDVGGGCPNGKKLKAIQCGGASGPIVGTDKLDTKMSIEDCNAAGANFGAGDLMFIDEDQGIVDLCENLMEFFEEESCGKCTPCREGNFRLLELVRKFKDGTGTETDLDTIEDLASTMMDASLCGLGQASPIPLVSAIKYFRNEFLEGGNH
jgi:NADH:ubiquinone oxidoreductase subunit F (NADH-binding)